jgi:hypothetical protein
VLRRRGAIAHPGVRPPAASLDATTKAALDLVLEWVDPEHVR